MNIVERKTRLAEEIMANPHAAAAQYDTDDQDSEEVDIFERKDNFEKLLKKFQEHRKQKGLLLKGNDLQSNVYLKKMEKMAKMDLGLDIIGYKDYLSNLKQFAAYNDDMTVLAAANLWGDDVCKGSKSLIEVEAEKLTADECKGIERAMKYTDAVTVAMSKLMRKDQNYINARDIAALDDFEANMGDYLAMNMILAEKVRRFYKEQRLIMNEAEDWDVLYEEMENVTM